MASSASGIAAAAAARGGTRSVRDAADRALLRDLARIRVLPRDLIVPFYYPRRRVADRHLARLEACAFLESTLLHVASGRTQRIYRFAAAPVAAIWGDPVAPMCTTARLLHDVLTARAYFALGRPAGFRVAVHLPATPRWQFESHCPDAVFPDPGGRGPVLVESDSGQYTRRQIREKLGYWRCLGFGQQVWVQPADATAAPVPVLPGIRLLRL